MGSHAGAIKEFRMILPEHSLIGELFPEQNQLHISLHPYMMSRIIDFAIMVTYMKSLQEGTFNVEVISDDQCPWNIGVWQITNQAGQVSCKQIEDGLVDYSGPITAWTQVFLGRLSMSDAVKLGLITDYRIKKLDFKKGDISFYDYF